MKLSYCLIFLLFCITSFSQIEFKGSPIIKIEKAATINRADLIQSNWNINLKSFEASPNKSAISDIELEQLKKENDIRVDESKTLRNSILDPIMNINFEGNKGTGSVPPDNTIAVSTNGFIITSINSNLIFTTSSGKTLKSISLGDFFTDLRLGGNYFDPKVLFDYEERKFIIVCLSGSSSDISNITIGFSETENPLGKWNVYAIKGDVNNEDVWFDYPNIGVNNEDLFISGNMFADEGGFRYSTVLQIDKDGGYKGDDINYKHYTKMKRKNTNQNLFNVTPCPGGWNYYNDELMYFLVNDTYGGNIVSKCQINKKVEDNPSFIVNDGVFTDEYEVAPNAPQKGNSDPLKTIDCRIMYGIELNGILHYVFGSGANGRSGFHYGRYNLASNYVNTFYYSEPNMYLAYPSISAFGKSENDTEVLIHYLRSNENLYAETAAVICSGTNDDFTWSNPILIKEGLGSVNAISGEYERWGDYTGSFRRYWNEKSEVWNSSCIGRSSFGSWTSQVLAQNDNGERERFNDFEADKTLINPGDTITIKYFGDSISYHDLLWNYFGGTFINSDSNSVTLRYDSLGYYDINLFSINNEFDLVKQKYISVVPVVFAPVSNFYAEKVNAYVGDTIRFFDTSTNVPELWRWTLSGGTPNTSSLQNPQVTYAKKGQYSAILVTKNTGGEDVEVKPKYITITERPIKPVAEFAADQTLIVVGDSVQFTSQSQNSPTLYLWVFQGADVDSSLLANPIIKYSTEGVFPVTLIVGNDAGRDTIIKTNYITVGTSSIDNNNWILKGNVYPNPVTNDEFYLEFYLDRSMNLEFDLFNSNGLTIKHLLEKNAKFGKNLFTFNTGMLSAGIYFLRAKEKESTFSKTFKFIVK